MYQSKVTYRLKTGDPQVVTITTRVPPIDQLSLPEIQKEVYFSLTSRPPKIEDIIIINVDDVTIQTETPKPINPFVETINGMEITRIAIRQGLEVYEIGNHRTLRVTKYVIFNPQGVEVTRCRSVRELDDFFRSLQEKADLAMPNTKIESIRNKIAELSAHGLNANEIATDSSLKLITRPELIRIIMSYQRGE